MKCSVEEFKKYYLLVKQGKIANKTAAKVCGYTPEHFTRLRKKYENLGERLFINARKGKPSPKAIDEKTKKFITETYLTLNTPDIPINFAYFTEKLHENYGITLSYRTIYNILTQNNINSPEKHNIKRKKVHRIRFRRKHFGELVQWDATPFQWFKWAGDNKYYTLHGALDDATSKFLGLYMTENECRYGYIECRRQVLENYGIELEDYTDRSPVFYNNYKEQTQIDLQEQLSGQEKKKPLWEEMNEKLKVKLHLALYPQGKGKIERAWETVQSRLVNEMRERNITSVREANIFLYHEFINYYNKRFSKKPISNTSIFRPLPQTENIENILCVKEKRVVSKNGYISFKGLKFRIVGIKHYGIIGDICINEKSIWFLQNGKSYELKPINDKYNLSEVPAVLEKIIYDLMYSDMHRCAA